MSFETFEIARAERSKRKRNRVRLLEPSESLEIHVVPHPRGGWAIRKGGSDRCIKRYDTKVDAISGAGTYTFYGFRLIIHRRDGTVQ